MGEKLDFRWQPERALHGTFYDAQNSRKQDVVFVGVGAAVGPRSHVSVKMDNSLRVKTHTYKKYVHGDDARF